MYILIIILIIVNLIYLIYMKYVFFKSNSKSFPLHVYLYILSSIIIIWWMMYIKDIYYFYLFWETLNILSYILLINLSTNIQHYKGLIAYYFLRFLSSILFIISIYGISQNVLSFYILNIALTLKFRLYPFSNIMSTVYKNLGYIAFLTISYLFYFQYFIILIIFNSQNLFKFSELLGSRFLYTILIILCILTSFYGAFMFDKQSDVKRF